MSSDSRESAEVVIFRPGSSQAVGRYASCRRRPFAIQLHFTQPE